MEAESYIVVGHYCPTDANPYEDIEGTLGVLDQYVSAEVVPTLADAETLLLWYVDGRIISTKYEIETPQ